MSAAISSGAPVVRGPILPAAADQVRALAAGLQSIGWEVRTLDVDHVAGRFVLEVHRFDGRWLYLTGDDIGRVNLERWHRDPVVRRAFGAPNGAQFDSHEDRFLGRTRPEGVRSGLRSLASYVADNPAPGFPALPAGSVRALLAPLLDGAR